MLPQAKNELSMKNKRKSNTSSQRFLPTWIWVIRCGASAQQMGGIVENPGVLFDAQFLLWNSSAQNQMDQYLKN